MKRIGVVTGTRAEYGYLRPLLHAISSEPTFELRVYATGMHLLKEYGDSIKEIENDGFEIIRRIDMGSKAMLVECDLPISIGTGIIGFANTFAEEKPDLVIVFGDRTEPFAAAIASTTMNTPVAHIAGGEIGMGDIDHVMRHAISKLSHLHFVQTEESRHRLIKLGEEDWRIHNVGALTLDTILNTELYTREELSKRLSFEFGKFILIAYHPVSTEWQDAESQMRLVLDAVAKVATESNLQIVITYPNDYPGGTRIVDVTNSYSDRASIQVFKNLSHIDYISLMKLCEVYIGNSSSGLIEAPSLGVPYVCIGTRQKGRERARNVIDVDYDEDEIKSALRKALHDSKFLESVAKCDSPYGDGKASQRITEVLKHTSFDNRLLRKKMTY